MYTNLINCLSVGQIFKYIHQRIHRDTCPHKDQPATSTAVTIQKEKLLTNLPEEVLLHIIESLLPNNSSRNNWIADIKNLQYTCKLFFRLGFVARNTHLLPFFNFKDNLSGNASGRVSSKIAAWFFHTRNMQHAMLWKEIDSLIMSPNKRPFDVYKLWGMQKDGFNQNESLANLVELNLLNISDLKEITLNKAQHLYITSKSAFWSIIKENPDFSYFKKIPDDFLKIDNFRRIGNSKMLIKAFRENIDVFNDMIRSKVCLHYRDPFTNQEPFIDIISSPENDDVMRAMAAYIDLHATYYKGENIIHAIAETGNDKALSYFHENNVDCKKKNYDGRSPIFFSVLHGHKEFTEKLIEYGESANIKDKEENTLLMILVQEIRYFHEHEIFLKLIQSGAEIYAINKDKKNVLHLLFESMNFRRFILIADIYNEEDNRENEISIKEQNSDRDFFIQMVKFIKMLTTEYSSLNKVKDKNGQTPFNILEIEYGKRGVRFIENLRYI